MRGESRGAKPRRVRWTLLVLLWIWAACIGLVLDLFLNVSEFDAIRPRAPLYRAARLTAHEMVGEACDDQLLAQAEGPARRRDTAAATSRPETGVPWLSYGLTTLPPSDSRHPGGKPDIRTPQGRKLLDGLVRAARTHEDPEKRAAALRSIEAMFGPEALREVESDTGEERPAEHIQTNKDAGGSTR